VIERIGQAIRRYIMDSEKPEKIAINHDGYHAEQIGRTKSGHQFFLTAPFVPAIDGSKGCEYISLFKFDQDGNLLESIIDSLGPRDSFNEEEAREKYFSRLHQLGEVEYCRIEVRPFSVEKDRYPGHPQ